MSKRVSIPRVIHYCWIPQAFVVSWDLPLAHYLCIASALRHIQPQKVLLWSDVQPSGKYWKLVEDWIEVRPVRTNVKSWGRKPILQVAHKADKVRLDVLQRHGGIYLDLDVLVLKTFDDLLDNEMVMGREKHYGLCNAVIASRPGSRFIEIWKRSYEEHFNPLGWAEGSVVLPRELARRHPGLIKMLPEKAFFYPSWDDSRRVFSQRNVLHSKSYAYHLWAATCQNCLDRLTEKSIRSGRSHFDRIAREYL